MPPHDTPEQRARHRIDAGLRAAGWEVQGRDEIHLGAARGVAIREFKMEPGYGYADYLLFVDGRAVGALEAKKEGFALTGVEPQVKSYSDGLPTELIAPHRPLPFLYLSTGVETRFVNLFDPRPRSRSVSGIHRPETLAEWLQADTLATWLASRAGGGAVSEGPGAPSSRPSTLRARCRACRLCPSRTSGRTRSRRSRTWSGHWPRIGRGRSSRWRRAAARPCSRSPRSTG